MFPRPYSDQKMEEFSAKLQAKLPELKALLGKDPYVGIGGTIFGVGTFPFVIFVAENPTQNLADQLSVVLAEKILLYRDQEQYLSSSKGVADLGVDGV